MLDKSDQRLQRDGQPKHDNLGSTIAIAELIISDLPTIRKKYIAMPPFLAGRNERLVHGIAPLATCNP